MGRKNFAPLVASAARCNHLARAILELKCILDILYSSRKIFFPSLPVC